MPDFAKALGASRGASTLLVLFIPSRDRTEQAIDQVYWVEEALTVLGRLFGGATAFPQGKGVWRDDAQGGKLLFDEPVIVQCYASEGVIESRADELKTFLHRMGREARQGAIGLVIASIATTWRSASRWRRQPSLAGRRARNGGNSCGKEN